MIKAEGLCKSYGSLQVLKEVSLEITQGEFVSIVGPSGAGKTTLLQIIGTLDRADQGSLIFNGNNIMSLNDKRISEFRNKNIGFVFQFHHLLPEFTALENVCIPGFIAKRPKEEVEKEAKKLLEELNIIHRMDHKPNELSGGEQQRVAVARALINKPSAVLADEPSGNLDSVNAKELHKLFYDLCKKTSQTFIIVTHNEELASMTDRKLTMRDGYLLN